LEIFSYIFNLSQEKFITCRNVLVVIIIIREIGGIVKKSSVGIILFCLLFTMVNTPITLASTEVCIFHSYGSELSPESLIIQFPNNDYILNLNFFWLGIVFWGCLAISSLLVFRNTQKRKKAEALLFTSQEKFYKALQYSAAVVGVAKLASGQHILVSEAFFDTFGYKREEVIGKTAASKDQENPLKDTFPLWLSTTEQNKFFNNLAANQGFKNEEVCWCTNTGVIRTGLYSAEILEVEDEPCIIYTWHDISNRKYAETTLQQAHDELENKVEQRTFELSSLNQELIAMNEELQSTNWELENEIKERRRMEEELSDSNEKLTQAIFDLQEMQTYLVESEKMASLGNLVAGIAHEVNTPVGVGLTAASHLQEITLEFENLCMHGTPRRQDLADYLKELHEVSTIILKNLERAGKLIQSFKQVASDQASEIGRVFNIKKYLEEIIFSMHPQLKKYNHNITLDCDETLTINGFPGAFSQIITNLIMNSTLHAYNKGDCGNIHISAKGQDKHLILLFSDDGKGMNCDQLSKIYDPFYTTKRGHGGTGLGLHLVYNIVTQQFKGTIDCESQPTCGTTFRIRLPLIKEDLQSGSTR